MPGTTDQYESILAETVMIDGHNGDPIRAYFARPLGPGPYPTMVLVHHMPGWDDWYKEVTLKFAHHGYATITPNLYERTGHGIPEDVAAMVRNAGGVPDEQVVGDLAAAARFVKDLPTSNGKTGIWGTCSGGRHGYLAACQTDVFDSVCDLWGGGVVMGAEDLTSARPQAPLDFTSDLDAPLLGLFGNEDRSPSPEQVDQHEALLKQLGKNYEFHRYDDAGHGFFYDNRPNYRQEQATDGWQKVWDFLGRTLN
ncbi:MAG: dienelactone hydrolase family protein [Chloroflexi bacterium]|nr:dienelactone hydrolase family protein [Chloroflexota bacterium]